MTPKFTYQRRVLTASLRCHYKVFRAQLQRQQHKPIKQLVVYKCKFEPKVGYKNRVKIVPLVYEYLFL